ncbi:glutathione S-transferase [Sphingobium lactosutens]|uniref:glutathione S-transferase n=1 Tax=Sphingobium lactosutens TaxID=522773 RepID=UPI0015BB5145|nr:glutathione S-transferase [Sphingobium lactosutens]NWK98387.1 glutathione S-transferase [Sphingobium lactosutens]
MTHGILYSFRRCPYAMRARLALVASRTCVELREVKLSAKPEAMLAASPKGTVPVLILPDGRIIDQSIDIMRSALARNDPEDWLNRDDPELIAMNDGPFKHDLDRYKYPERHGSDAVSHRAAALTFLEKLERRLATNSYLSGARWGMTDAAILPFVRQFAAVDQGWFDALPLPSLKTWLSEGLVSKLFATIMSRVPPWVPEEAPVFFPPQKG